MALDMFWPTLLTHSSERCAMTMGTALQEHLGAATVAYLQSRMLFICPASLHMHTTYLHTLTFVYSANHLSNTSPVRNK